MEDIYEKSILLIGGMAIGKSTVSEILSEKLNMELISSDAKKDEFLLSIPDYSFEKQLQIRKEYGFNAEANYLLSYLELTLNNILDSLNVPTIIDIGALNTTKLDMLSISKLKKFKNIILLKSDNLENILKRRNVLPNSELASVYIKTHRNPNNEFLCTQIICVDNKTPEEIVNEIINLICKEKRNNYKKLVILLQEKRKC